MSDMEGINLDIGRELPEGVPQGERTPADEDQVLLAEDEAALSPPVESVIPDEATRQAIQDYLVEEVDAVIEGDERAEAHQRWERYRELRRAEPEEEVKNTPWEGASNVCVPITATTCNTLFAHLKMSFAKRKPFFKVDTDFNGLTENAAALSRWLNRLVESQTHLDLRRKNNTILYDTISLGTQFIDVAWKVDKWHFVRTAEDGLGAEEVEKIVYDAPAIETPALEEYLQRTQWADPQKAKWCGFWYQMSWGELKRQEAIGLFQDVDRIEEETAKEMESNRAASAARMGVTSEIGQVDENELYDIIKVYLYWDIDNDGIEEDIVLWIERDSGTILSAEPNEIGRRPIVRLAFWEEPRQLYALGVAQMSYRMQEEIDTLHNIRINTLHLSSLQGWGVRRGLHEGITLKPPLILPLDDPQTDITPLGFQDVSGGTFNAEAIAKSYLERYVGASEAMQGQPDMVAKSGTSASLQAFLAQQGNVIHNASMESIADGYSEIGLVILMQCVANKDRVMDEGGILTLADETDRPLIEAVLNEIQVEDIPHTFRMAVRLSDIDETEDAKRQQLMMANQLYSMYFQEMMQVMGVMNNPQTPQQIRQFATQYYVGRTKLMEETFDLLNQEALQDNLPYTRNMELMLSMLRAMQEQQAAVMRDQMAGTGVGYGTQNTANPRAFPANAGGGPSAQGVEQQPPMGGGAPQGGGGAGGSDQPPGQQQRGGGNPRVPGGS